MVFTRAVASRLGEPARVACRLVGTGGLAPGMVGRPQLASGLVEPARVACGLVEPRSVARRLVEPRTVLPGPLVTLLPCPAGLTSGRALFGTIAGMPSAAEIGAHA